MVVNHQCSVGTEWHDDCPNRCGTELGSWKILRSASSRELAPSCLPVRMRGELLLQRRKETELRHSCQAVSAGPGNRGSSLETGPAWIGLFRAFCPVPWLPAGLPQSPSLHPTPSLTCFPGELLINRRCHNPNETNVKAYATDFLWNILAIFFINKIYLINK